MIFSKLCNSAKSDNVFTLTRASYLFRIGRTRRGEFWFFGLWCFLKAGIVGSGRSAVETSVFVSVEVVVAPTVVPTEAIPTSIEPARKKIRFSRLTLTEV